MTEIRTLAPGIVETAGHESIPSASHPLAASRNHLYRIIESVSWVTVSKVVTVFEFASKARCATIRSANSDDMSTLDNSNALSRDRSPRARSRNADVRLPGGRRRHVVVISGDRQSLIVRHRRNRYLANRLLLLHCCRSR